MHAAAGLVTRALRNALAVRSDKTAAEGTLGRSRRAYQNAQFPVATTQIPSAPLVTAWAMIATHSLPVRR